MHNLIDMILSITFDFVIFLKLQKERFHINKISWKISIVRDLKATG